MIIHISCTHKHTVHKHKTSKLYDYKYLYIEICKCLPSYLLLSMGRARITLSPTAWVLLHYSRTISQFLVLGSKLLKQLQGYIYIYLFMTISIQKIMTVLLLTGYTMCLLASLAFL